MAETARRAAASTTLRGLLTADDQVVGSVVGAFPTAVYVDLPGGRSAAHRELVTLETHDALRLPCAVVLPDRAADRPFRDVRVGMPATAGGSRLSVGPLAVGMARWWAPRRARPGAATVQAAWLARLLPPLEQAVAVATGALRGWLASGCIDDAARRGDAVRRLVGLGSGLTPAGDDVLAGALVTLAAVRPAAAVALGAAALDLAPRTTFVSAALLRHAADGLAVPALIEVIDALGDPVAADLGVRVDRLLAVGHSSGAALAHGVALALAATARCASEVA